MQLSTLVFVCDSSAIDHFCAVQTDLDYLNGNFTAVLRIVKFPLKFILFGQNLNFPSENFLWFYLDHKFKSLLRPQLAPNENLGLRSLPQWNDVCTLKLSQVYKILVNLCRSVGLKIFFRNCLKIISLT